MPENISYEQVDDNHTFTVVGDNGEPQAKSERYSSESNARRGAADLARTMLQAVAEGELDLSIGDGE